MPRALCWLAVWFVFSALVGCQNDEPQSRVTPVAKLASVPRPSLLLAELFVPRPSKLYQRLREQPQNAALLPKHVELFAATLLGLPASAASYFEPARPIFGALRRTGSGFGVAVAIPLRAPREFVAHLTTGNNAPFDKRSGPNQLVYLLSKQSGFSLAVYGQFLVVANDPDSLELAPYIVRSVAARTLPREGIAVLADTQALRGNVLKSLDQNLQALTIKLRALSLKQRLLHAAAPELGEPEAVLQILDEWGHKLRALLGSSEQLRITFEVEGSVSVLRARALGKGAALLELRRDLPGGDLAPLRQFPAQTSLGLVARSTLAARKATAVDVHRSLKSLFGSRLGPSDSILLRSVFEAFAEGRGDWLAVARLAGKPSGLLLRASVRDPAAMQKALGRLKLVLRLPAIRAILEREGGTLSVSERAVPKQSVMTRVLKLRISGADPSFEREVRWQINEAVATIAISEDGAEPLLDTTENQPPALGAAFPELFSSMSAEAEPNWVAFGRFSPWTQPLNTPWLLSFGKLPSGVGLELRVPSESFSGMLRRVAAP